MSIKGGYWQSFRGDLTLIHPSYNHVFYAFSGFDQANYRVVITPNEEPRVRKFISHVHSREVKALLSIGGADEELSKVFSDMASNPNSRRNFIQSAIEVARRFGFDGLDLDWEFPANQRDMENLAVLLAEWRAEVDKEARGRTKLLITMAVFFTPDLTLYDETPRKYPGGAIQRYVDFVNVMTYDYYGAFSKPIQTGASAAVINPAEPDRSTSQGLLSWLQLPLSPEKLVIGLPLYAHTWMLEDPDKNGIGATAVAVGPGENGILAYYELVDFRNDTNDHVAEVYDEATQSNYCYAGKSWISYTGERSVQAAVMIAKENQLGGFFHWAIGHDYNNTLTNAAFEAWGA